MGERMLMGRTRMQAAIPITVSDRLRTWIELLLDHKDRLQAMDRDLFAVQFGGAAGTLDKLKDRADVSAPRRPRNWRLPTFRSGTASVPKLPTLPTHCRSSPAASANSGRTSR